MKSHPEAKVFHCRHHYIHIFFDETLLKKHEEEECEKHPDKVKAKDLEVKRKYQMERDNQWKEFENEQQISEINDRRKRTHA